MSDQADKLRQLVYSSTPVVRDGAALAPTIVVSGGKGGVGSTTVAINLAAALAQSGRRTVLVDAAAHADVAPALGIEIERGMSLEYVLTGAIDAIDALASGPAGMSVLAGQWAPEAAPDRSLRSLERLIEQLQTLDTTADVLVVDAGSGVNHWSRRLWQAAMMVLVVSTPDDMAVMDAYATIKRGIEADAEKDIRVLVNACQDGATAADVQSRITAACRRFLGRTVGRAPLLPRHIGELGSGNAPPLAWNEPASPFARSAHQLGRFAADVLAAQKRMRHQQREACAC